MMTQPETWTHDFVSTNGIRLHYVSQGDGPLMLMLHGFPEFWYSWRHQIPAFADRYKVVAVDLRGYNESDKPTGNDAYQMKTLIRDVAGVISGLGYERCVLVGHDWGGAIAWAFANEYPEQVERLITLNIPHPAKFQEGLRTPQQLLKSWYIFFFQLPWIPEWAIRFNDYRAIATAFQDMAVNPETFTPDDLDAYKNAAAKPGALSAMLGYYRSAFQRLFPPQQTATWRQLPMPTLMIWGEEDVALGKELTYDTQTYVPDLTIHYIPNCSHWVQQEQPELVNQYIRAFLNGN